MKTFWHNVIRNFVIATAATVGTFVVQVNYAQAAQTLPDNYPLVANYFLDPVISDAEAEALAKWDLVIIGMETQYNSPNAHKIMREINPDIVILAYVASEEIGANQLALTDVNDPAYKLYHQFNFRDDIWLKTTTGERSSIWPGTQIVNVTTNWNEILPDFVTNEVLKKYPEKWNGVFYDNCFNDISWVNDGIDINQDGIAEDWRETDRQWKDGMTKIMKRTRKQNKNKFIVCNSNGDYYTYINGRLMEGFPSEDGGGWPKAMDTYFDVLERGKTPSIVVINTVANSFQSTNYKLMRYSLTSTLMGEGFASFDQSIANHASLWWYDEYDVALGKPLAGPFNTITNKGAGGGFTEGVWRRNFENGIAIVNSTNQTRSVVLEQGFEKILGTQDTLVNDGRVIGKVTIPPKDGVILLGRLSEVADAPYLNGSFANVYSQGGTRLRNPFFSYDSKYPGSQLVATVRKRGITVVADDTYVYVYEGGRLKSKFAPYGTGFRGGINFAVDKLKPKRKAYHIVTGTESGGAHVRIFDASGKLINTGCFPYGTGFRGGVNVAIGNVKKEPKGREIIVGAGEGGGPHVRVLDKNCKELGPGFLAYNGSLRSGVEVAAGNINAEGIDEIVTIPGKGAAPFVRSFNASGKELTPGFYAFSKSDLSSKHIVISDVNGDGRKEIVAMTFSIFNQ